MKGRCRYAKNALDDRQFLSSRRHRHQLKIQFEKSNNTAQFARKCISRSSCDGIVRRVDTMRPIGGTTPDFYSVRRPRLFSTTAVHYRRRGNPSICPYFLSSCNSFFHRRRFGCTRARYNRRRVTACPICIPRSKSGRSRWFPVCHRYLFSRFSSCISSSTMYTLSMILIYTSENISFIHVLTNSSRFRFSFRQFSFKKNAEMVFKKTYKSSLSICLNSFYILFLFDLRIVTLSLFDLRRI